MRTIHLIRGDLVRLSQRLRRPGSNARRGLVQGPAQRVARQTAVIQVPSSASARLHDAPTGPGAVWGATHRSHLLDCQASESEERGHAQRKWCLMVSVTVTCDERAHRVQGTRAECHVCHFVIARRGAEEYKRENKNTRPSPMDWLSRRIRKSTHLSVRFFITCIIQQVMGTAASDCGLDGDGQRTMWSTCREKHAVDHSVRTPPVYVSSFRTGCRRR